MSRAALLDHFSALSDPRQCGKVVYPLPEIMLLVLCATLAVAEDLVEIQQWGRRKLDFLRGLLPFARGIPSHDTLNDVMNALDGGLFPEAFAAWVEGLREDEPDIVAIDGKTSRRARGGVTGIRCMSFRPGPCASGWFRGKRQRQTSLTRSMRSRCCLNACT